jgi:protein-tyrosine phosphatase
MKKIHNFRDFGGYKTQNGLRIKPGLLFRSGSLANRSDNDQKKLSSLGIKTILDLRTNKERTNNPDRIPDNSKINSIHIPIKVTMHDESGIPFQLFSLLFGKARKIDYHEAMKQVYQEYVTDFRSEFSEIIRLVSLGNNLPILIHCTGGKDRTGFACSLIQLILGVPLKTVVLDYLKTNEYLHEVKDEFQKRLKKFSLFGASIEKLLPLFEARKEYWEAAYDQIRNDYGTVQNFVQDGLNVSDEEMLRLNNLLLEKADYY